MSLPPDSFAHASKSRSGLGRIPRAALYSWRGLKAAVQHEVAFRQELLLGIPMALFALWWAPTVWIALAMIGSVVLVWVTELLNSAVEAVADALTTERHPLIGRAKDIGSAAVFLSLLFCGAVWAVALLQPWWVA